MLSASKSEARTTGAVQASGAGRQWLTAGMAALGLLLLETLVYLSIPGAALMAAGFRTASTKKATKATAVTQPKAKGKGGRKANITIEQALAILRSQAKQNDGRISASGAALARMLGVGRSTVCDPAKGWLAHWVKTGAVVIEKRGEYRVIERKAA
jgi:hypothetical protein